MEDSILTSIKKLLGIMESCTDFDTDILLHINSAFSTLCQLGLGPDEGFMIMDDSTTWDEYLGDDARIGFVKTYIYLKVRVLFDPPQSSSAMTAIQENIKELEWRINVAVDPKEKEVT